MPVEHVPCAPFVNESERRACAEVLKALRARAGSGRPPAWVAVDKRRHP